MALLRIQRELYNAALEERRGAWRLEHRRVTRYEQYRTLTALREVRPDVLDYGVTVCRGTLKRLDDAFSGFYRRVGAGKKPGYPRFKGAARFDSVSYPDSSCWRLEEGSRRLYLQGVGHVKVRLHRPVRGTPKTLTVRRRGRRWEATVFCAKVPPEPLPATGRQVGIDLGVAVLVATSDGELVANPRPRRALSDRLAAAKRDRARRRRGSVRYRRASERIAAVKAKEARDRRNHLHKVSRSLVDTYDLICHEALRITDMSRSARGTIEHPGRNVAAKSGLNDAIADSGWGQLLGMVAYKAEDAGRQVVAVDPRHTSQRCAACGHVAKENRVSQAEFRCRACGHTAHADVNAACNILRAGLAQHLGGKREDSAA